ncbi:Ribokinase-like protein [Nemania sp. NC0429]|nr:Ribokinase-like protein [Nemania sp. NC0429]
MGQTISAILTKQNAGRAPPCFVSLGLVELNEIRYRGRPAQFDVPGGAGLFATFGARLFKPGAQAKDVGCLILTGRDYPYMLFRRLKSWNMTLHVVYKEGRPFTKTAVDYRPLDPLREIQTDLTEPLKPRSFDLSNSILLRAKSFHMRSLPLETRGLVSKIGRMRREIGLEELPLIVWEPHSAGCTPETMLRHYRALRRVNVFSPTYDDLFRLTIDPLHKVPFSREKVEDRLDYFFDDVSGGPKPDGLVVVVRCGHHGCFYMGVGEEKGWVRSFWEHGRPEVVDATGSESAFLGAFTVAFLETRDVKASCLRGQVAASFASQQFGLPKRSKRFNLNMTERPYSLTSEEVWNGEDPMARLSYLEELDKEIGMPQ